MGGGLGDRILGQCRGLGNRILKGVYFSKNIVAEP